MFKKKFRMICKRALEQAGYEHPVLMMDRMGKVYNSYWGSGMRRAEVVCEKGSGTVYIFEARLVP